MGIAISRLGHDGTLEKATFGSFSRGIDSKAPSSAPTFEWIEEPLAEARGAAYATEIIVLELIVALDRAGALDAKGFADLINARAGELRPTVPANAAPIRTRIAHAFNMVSRVVDAARQEDARR